MHSQGLIAAKADFGGNAPEDDEAGATVTAGGVGNTSISVISNPANNLNAVSASMHSGSGNAAVSGNNSNSGNSSSSNSSSSAGGDGYNPMSLGGNGHGFFVVTLLRACGHAAVFGIRSLYVGMAASDAHAALPHAPFTLVPRLRGAVSNSSGSASKSGDKDGSGRGAAWSAKQELLELLLRDLVPMCSPVIAAARHNTAVRTNLGADRRPCALADCALMRRTK
jgi:hypothetical protein